jgi:Polyketide cyclase / dehydrase and lipid transport
MSYVAFVERKLPLSRSVAFSYLSNFGGLAKIMPSLIKSLVLTGEGIGSERAMEIHSHQGVVVERLDAIVDQRVIAYSIVNDAKDSPLKAERYVSVIELSDEGEASCTVRWGSNWVAAQGASKAEVKGFLENSYVHILDGIVALESA